MCNRIAIILLMLVASSVLCKGQRTMSGQTFIGTEGFYNGNLAGGDVTIGRYTINAFWFGSLSVSPYSVELDLNDGKIFGKAGYLQTLIYGGYQYRVISSRKRNANLYLGGAVFAGLETFDPFSKLPSNIDTGFSKHTFIYGLTPMLSLEIFVSRVVSLTASCRVPVNFSSKISLFHYNTGAGIKIML